jgi:type IV pilus assembly protein PilB
VRVRYRMDGMLKNVLSYPKIQHNAVVIRIKIMANMDISERRLPQDGKFYLKVAGEQYDFRVSTVPTVHGEKVVMRILKVSSANKRLEDLGFNEYNVERIEKLLSEPYGIILVTGPTGSGKSTTLVAMINELKDESVNIVTAEDPVEYTIEGVNQSQVRPEIGLTFARYLRAFLRQDPDIIMVGEIRDRETAQLAVEASMTGHLVLSTLHTNDASSAVDRLRNMGVDPRLVASSLLGVVAQRLVRKINRACKTKRVPLRPDLARYYEEYFKDQYEPFEYIADESCNELYRGRTAIGEVLVVNDEIRDLITSSASVSEIQKEAVHQGMRPMFVDGLEKVLKSETTVEEILRVVHFSEL